MVSPASQDLRYPPGLPAPCIFSIRRAALSHHLLRVQDQPHPEAAEKAAQLRQAEETKSRLLQMASEKIAPLQDAVDLGIATDDEKARLDEWKKYRVLVNRMDTAAPDWPERPASQ